MLGALLLTAAIFATPQAPVRESHDDASESRARQTAPQRRDEARPVAARRAGNGGGGNPAGPAGAPGPQGREDAGDGPTGRERAQRQRGSIVDFADPDDDGTLGATFSGTGPHQSQMGNGLPGTRQQISVRAVPRASNLVQLTLQDPGTGFVETALLSVPVLSHGAEAPLLVCYHAFGHTEFDIPVHTSYFHEGFQRNWFVLASLGATKKSFSSVESQINRAAILDIVLSSSPRIDRERIYAVGFSMGGGAAVNYAARNLDPEGPMFAAIVNHSGASALRHVYSNEWDDTDEVWEDPPLEGPDVLDFWHAGAPSPVTTFSYQRSSSIDLDPVTNVVIPGVNLAINLRHVPMLNYRLTNDIVPYAALQTSKLHEYLISIGGTSDLMIVGGSFHDWSTLDETLACDFLAQHQLNMPTGGDILADRDATYFHFDLEQDVADAWTRLAWSMTPVENILSLTNTENLQRVTVETTEGGLDTADVILVITSTVDGLPDEIRLRDFPAIPGSIRRDGQAESAWSYDAPSQTLTLSEYDGGSHTWEIVP